MFPATSPDFLPEPPFVTDWRHQQRLESARLEAADEPLPSVRLSEQPTLVFEPDFFEADTMPDGCTVDVAGGVDALVWFDPASP
jgi:hypothetical protein